MTCGVIVQVLGEPPTCARRIQRPNRLDRLSPETAAPYDNELARLCCRHGTDLARVEFASAATTTDTTCFCCESVI